MSTNILIEELRARGLIAQTTADEELDRHLSEGMRTVYVGFDPTADSLHIGSLVPLLTLKRFQMAGHKPIALVGGATGLVGDPSFKAQERQLNTSELVGEWVEKIRSQVSRFVEFDCGENAAEVVNNLDWTANLDVLSFLRDIGKHFSVNQMVKKESVKQRIEREGEGISFTEFTYMILQSLDFSELYNQHGCTIQMGGSDQWGNIVGGIELTRRRFGGHVFGLTVPLVTKADGTKFGKTESGTVWLDSKKTSPYAFFQFWLNTADADVYKFLRYFTFLSLQAIDVIEGNDKKSGERPKGQGILAEEVTRLIHGEEGLAAAMRISKALFNGELRHMSESDFEQLRLDGLPASSLSRSDLEGRTLTQVLAESGVVATGKQAKDALAAGSVLVNADVMGVSDNMGVLGCFASARALFERYYLVKLGKKKYHLFEIS